jgi:CO/xanthine dehydrogenase Mo-binding subunit
VSLPQLLTACAREAGADETEHGWRLPSLADRSNRKRGLGIAVGMKNSGFSFGFPEGSRARVILHGGATIERAEVHTAAADVGQGSHSALAQIVAETLDLPLAAVEMVTGDTALIGDSGPASASRLTLFAGNAVKRAAELAQAEWRDEERPAVGDYRWNAPPTTPPDPETGACDNSVSFSYGAQAAEVEVDVDTGQVFLTRVIAAHDPGRAVNPQQVVGQIEGGVIQAQGWALIEDFRVQCGRILTDRLSTYLIPTAVDIPTEVKAVIHEKGDPVGPFGVRGVGEIVFIPLAPAIVCAVHDALGIWFDCIPFRPERVLKQIETASRRGDPPCGVGTTL